MSRNLAAPAYQPHPIMQGDGGPPPTPAGYGPAAYAPPQGAQQGQMPPGPGPTGFAPGPRAMQGKIPFAPGSSPKMAPQGGGNMQPMPLTATNPAGGPVGVPSLRTMPFAAQ